MNTMTTMLVCVLTHSTPLQVSIEEIRRAPFPKFKPGGGARKAKVTWIWTLLFT